MFERVTRSIAAYGKKLARGALVRRLVRREDGAVAIEFSLVAMPFFALVFAILETSVVFFAGQVLETAVGDSSRLILTGQAQKSGMDVTAFRTAICNKTFGLFDCSSGIKIDVRTAASFASADTSKPLDQNGNISNNLTYDPGVQGDVVIVRVMYQWPIWVQLMGLNLADMPGGTRLLMATVAFRNEPY
jgi:Flp pilus assembly protein TadG